VGASGLLADALVAMPVNQKWPLDINSLWELRDENTWLDALNRYWVNPTVSKNRHTEQFMDKLELQYIQRLDTQEWYDFLNKYFRWKFMGNHLHERLMDGP
jgi:hypothetical protein